jgi:hypothetical protein
MKLNPATGARRRVTTFIRRSISAFLLIPLICGYAHGAMIDKAMGAYASGNPAEARRMARAILADNPRDARALLLMARTESGGRTAQSWAQQALNAAGDQPPADEATLILIDAFAATKAYGAIIERAESFSRDFERQNPYADAIRWWDTLAKLKLGRLSAAEANINATLDQSLSSTWARRLQLLHCDSRDDAEAAVDAYRNLMRVADRYIESQCLMGLAQTYERLGEDDRMMLYRGILSEKYPNTDLLFTEGPAAFSPAATSPADDEAEKLADIVYTIQLGAFADKKNAQRLRDKYRNQGYTVHFFSRRVAGKSYWVVQVGSYTKLEQARKLQDKLQAEEQVAYRVVVR